MLLLDFGVALAGETGLALAVVHFNHHLRGTESDADERFVRERAAELHLDFLCSGADVAGIAREKRRNLEATARELRYRFFFSLVRQGKLDVVATAHTADDQAETVLLRLLRGAGTRGLGGIHPALEGGIVRPFLSLTRAEVEAEISRRGLVCRLDTTNHETRFARNRIRQRVLPLLAQEFNPRVVQSLAGFADRARDDEAYLQEQAHDRARAWLVREGDALRIPAERLGEFPVAIARRVLRQMVADAARAAGITAGPPGISHAETESLLQLAAEGQSGKGLVLAAGVEALRQFEWLLVRPRPRPAGNRAGGPRVGFSYTIEPPAEIAIRELGLCFAVTLAPTPDAKVPEGEYTNCGGVWFDTPELTGPLTLRSWRAGDRFRSSENSRPVKLSDLFQRRRIPAGERSWWPVLEYAGEVVWVRGFAPAPRAQAHSGRRLFIGERPL